MIHIATVDLTPLPEDVYSGLYRLASQERRQQADRCLKPADARRCIVADGLLRYVLRHTIGTDQVTLARTQRGKPFLPDLPDFHFNLSHSGGWVVIGWADRPVGIDVETFRPREGKDALARRFFHADEQTYLADARDGEWLSRFFEIWTKKESYLKYLGTGIDRPLNSFSVFDALGAGFDTRRLDDAMLTLCAEDPVCQIIPLTTEMLLPE